MHTYNFGCIDFFRFHVPYLHRVYRDYFLEIWNYRNHIWSSVWYTTRLMYGHCGKHRSRLSKCQLDKNWDHLAQSKSSTHTMPDKIKKFFSSLYRIQNQNLMKFHIPALVAFYFTCLFKYPFDCTSLYVQFRSSALPRTALWNLNKKWII